MKATLNARHTLLLVCLLTTIITIGCGNANSKSSHSSAKATGDSSDGGTITGRVVPRLNVTLTDHSVKLSFALKNQTERDVTYHFNTAQRFDYIIKDQNGAIVKKFSHGRMFAQVLGEMTLKANGEKTFQDTIPSLAPGNYTAEFWLTANESQPKASKAFVVH
ncbi:BsuPI-related putative proteinase inhibitor [Camelliibacillus cellulosilyticus]|uniref:Intracellular proteinase inhibitor BsuPI domain-containing protein n=1 Tax=Camelliibacillus cellulosilyticus TaxID=2174486 RepID=A0ABV9GQ09_9BACL